MKQKLVLILALVALVQFDGFSQFAKSKKMPAVAPLIVEEDIRDISIGDNIDLVLIQSPFEKVAVKVQEVNVTKVKVKLDEFGGVHISTSKNILQGERITVYAYVNQLEVLSLGGNSFVISRGILNSRQLVVNINGMARVSVKSTGKVFVNTKGKYQISKDNEAYSSVFASE